MQVSFRSFKSNDSCIFCSDLMNDARPVVGHDWDNELEQTYSEVLIKTNATEEAKENAEVVSGIRAHIFHKECLGKWLILDKTCPICRKMVDFNSVISCFSWKDGALIMKERVVKELENSGVLTSFIGSFCLAGLINMLAGGILGHIAHIIDPNF